MSHEIDTIPLDAVRINGGTQSRVELNQVTIAEYAEAIRAAVELPPVITFFDGSTFWLADGFHRYNAHCDAGAMEINAEIRTGTQRDAILFSVGANASHGLRRTNEDKRRAVETLLGDSEWSAWSQEKIAKACGVSTGFVSKLVNDSSIHREEMRPTTRTVERNGTTYEQNTANIGKAKSAQAGGQSDPKTAETRMDTGVGGGAQTGPVSASTKPLIANGTAIDFPTISAGAGPGDFQGAADVDPENFGPSPEEIATAFRAEAEQLEYIKNLLASDDDPLALALADVKQKCLEISALRSQNAGHQNTINDQIRMIKSLRSKLAKLERPA
jgi:hypothetical protein